MCGTLVLHVAHTDGYVERKQAVKQVERDQGDKLAVIATADAVVQPETVMVESLDALVALSAVLGRSIDPFLANAARKYLSRGRGAVLTLLLCGQTQPRIIMACFRLESLRFLLCHMTSIALRNFVGQTNHSN